MATFSVGTQKVEHLELADFHGERRTFMMLWLAVFSLRLSLFS